MFLIILLSILSGIALAALYAFLVMRFTSSYDREISIIFFPIPFILGASICYSFAYNQKISGALAVICTLVFFKFIMGTLGVTFSKVYERLTLPNIIGKTKCAKKIRYGFQFLAGKNRSKITKFKHSLKMI